MFSFSDKVCSILNLLFFLPFLASYSSFPMESSGSAYNSYSSGYSSRYGSGGGYSSGGYSSGGFSSGSGLGGFSGGSGLSDGSMTQSKKSVVIKMIETKDGKVVSESSEVVQD